MSLSEKEKLENEESYKIFPLLRITIRFLTQTVMGFIDTGAVVSLATTLATIARNRE